MDRRYPAHTGNAAVGYSPIADDDEGGSVPDDAAANDLADGIDIRDPPRGRQIRHAIDETDGAAVAVSAAERSANATGSVQQGFTSSRRVRRRQRRYPSSESGENSRTVTTSL